MFYAGLDDIKTISDLWDAIKSTLSFGLVDQIGFSESACVPWYLAKMFVNWAAIIAGLVLLGFILYGGYMYMTSAGDPGKVENGQKTIVNGLIGFAIVVLAWSVAGLVQWLFGVGNDCDGSPGMPMNSDMCAEDCINTDPTNTGGYINSVGNCICTK